MKDEVVSAIEDDDLVFEPESAPKTDDEPAVLMQTALPPGAQEFVLEALDAGSQLAQRVGRRVAGLRIGTSGLLPAGVTVRRARYFNFGLLRDGDPGPKEARQWGKDALVDPVKLPWDALVFEDPARKASFPALERIEWPVHRHGEDVYYSLTAHQRTPDAISARFNATFYTHQTRGFWLDLADGTPLPPPGSDFDDETIEALAERVTGGWVDVYDGDLLMFWKVLP